MTQASHNHHYLPTKRRDPVARETCLDAGNGRTSTLGATEVNASATLQTGKNSGYGEGGKAEPKKGVGRLRFPASLPLVAKVRAIGDLVAVGITLEKAIS